MHAASTASPSDATTATLVEKALRLTSQRKLGEAETLYREVVTSSPAEGLPLLARFLHRTGRTTDAIRLLEDPQAEKLSPLARARTAVAAGSPEHAVEILRNAPPSPADEYPQASLLANTLHMLKRPEEAGEVLVRAVISPRLSAADRRDLFRKLAVVGGAGHLRRALPPLVSELVTSSSLAYPDLRSIATDGMLVIAGAPEYADFHRDLEANSSTSASIAWLHALSLVRKGDAPQATRVLEGYTTRPLSPREKMVVFEELARMLPEDPARAIALYREIIPLAPDPDRLRLTAAQILFRGRQYDEAATILGEINPQKLDEAQTGIYKNVLLASLGSSYPKTPLIDVFAREAAGLPWERLREIAEAPFVTMPSSVFGDLRRELEKKSAATTAPAELHVLRLSLANRLDDASGIMDALGDFVAARPDVVDAVQEYADAAAQRAYLLATKDPQSSPPAELAREAGDTAASALWRVVAVKPYIPEPYLKLIELYRLYGQPEKAQRVPESLARSTTATAEEVHLAAYVSAQADLIPQAIGLYERALKLEPGNTRFRLNYAGALTRAGRHKEADRIYRDIIENGVYGRQYHAHEIYANSIRNAEAFGYRDEYMKFLRGLIPRRDIPQHDYYLLEMGKVLLGLHMTEEAIPFFQALHDQYPQHAYQATDYMVQAHVTLGRFQDADRLLAAQQQESTDTASLVLVRSNMATTKAARGDVAAAIEEWRSLAKKYPQERQATRGLISASQLLVQAGRLRAATDLLESFLALDTGDPDGEASARELLTRIRNKDLPSDILVKSALEGATPPQ